MIFGNLFPIKVVFDTPQGQPELFNGIGIGLSLLKTRLEQVVQTFAVVLKAFPIAGCLEIRQTIRPKTAMAPKQCWMARMA